MCFGLAAALFSASSAGNRLEAGPAARGSPGPGWICGMWPWLTCWLRLWAGLPEWLVTCDPFQRSRKRLGPFVLAGGGAGARHQGLPVVERCGSAHQFGGLGGADGLARAAFGEQGEDGVLERGEIVAGADAAAGIAAVLEDVPVARQFGTPCEGAAAGLAQLVAVRRGAVGARLAVGHGGYFC